MYCLISDIILMWSLPHFSDTNKLRKGLQFLLFEIPWKEHLVWPQHSWLLLRTLLFEIILFMLLNFPTRIRRLTRCDMHATAWSCLFTLHDFMSLHRSGTPFFGLSCIFQEPKNPPVSQDRLSHTKILLPLERPVLFPAFPPVLPLHRSNLRFWPTKTFGEKPEWSNPGTFCWFYILFFFLLFSMVKLVPYKTKPISVQNCLGHSMPTPKRNETAHMKTQKVTVTTDIPGVPVSQGFLPWTSCRAGYYVSGPPRDSEIR